MYQLQNITTAAPCRTTRKIIVLKLTLQRGLIAGDLCQFLVQGNISFIFYSATQEAHKESGRQVLQKQVSKKKKHFFA